MLHGGYLLLRIIEPSKRLFCILNNIFSLSSTHFCIRSKFFLREID